MADSLTMHSQAALHTALNMYFVFLMGNGDYLGDGVNKWRKSNAKIIGLLLFFLSSQHKIERLENSFSKQYPL